MTLDADAQVTVEYIGGKVTSGYEKVVVARFDPRYRVTVTLDGEVGEPSMDVLKRIGHKIGQFLGEAA